MLMLLNVQQAGKAKPKGRKAPSKSVLQPTTVHNEERSVEDIYQKKTQLEHILLRPDTYIGSTEKQQQKMWFHTEAGLAYSDIEYVPGLYKIFDEILVNAADNKVRDPSMDTLRVDLDAVSGPCLLATLCAQHMDWWLNCIEDEEMPEKALQQHSVPK